MGNVRIALRLFADSVGAVKRSGVLLVVLACLLLATPAEAYLSKADARLSATSEAYDFSTGKTWASTIDVGACSRISAKRVDCHARVSGDDFIDCYYSGETLLCEYVFHDCQLKIKVVEAGYGTAERVISKRCSTRVHFG